MKLTLPALIALLVIVSCQDASSTQHTYPDPGSTDSMQAALKKGLVAYYPFDGNAHDESGNGLDGEAVGAVSYGTDRAGAAAKSLQLNGDNSFIKVDDNDKLHLSNTMTISFQFNPATSDPYSLISKRDRAEGYQDWHIMSNYSGSPLVFGVIKGGACSQSNSVNDWSDAFSSNAHQVKAGQWHCMIATFDGTKQAIYLDGDLVANETINFTTLAACANTEMRFGYWSDAEPFSFTGRMDEIRIYNRVLTAAERWALCAENQ